MPDDFELTPERAQVAVVEGLAPERTFEKFCDYWRAASGANARKHDWAATWRNWCKTEADRLKAFRRPGVKLYRPPKTAEELEREAASAQQ